jgi:hypothetical protein
MEIRALKYLRTFFRTSSNTQESYLQVEPLAAELGLV